MKTSLAYSESGNVSADQLDALAMADQIATASKKRLRGRLGALSAADLRAVEEAITLHLGLPR